MNEYWNRCCLIVFTGVRAGISPCLRTDDKILQKLGTLLPSDSIRLHMAHYSNDTNVEEWPKINADAGQANGIFMEEQFRKAFAQGYRKVTGLFSCPEELGRKHLEEAFLSLRPLDFCLGPDPAGGIYLLGMSTMEASVLNPQPWGQEQLARSITRQIGGMKKIMYKLAVAGHKG
ncbi:MAG: DUF2064 domain-containing protein [Bacteroidia bacterium]|nr:DUF2064 domain-containing protein [Bacteroidia bacterium]